MKTISNGKQLKPTKASSKLRRHFQRITARVETECVVVRHESRRKGEEMCFKEPKLAGVLNSLWRCLGATESALSL